MSYTVFPSGLTHTNPRRPDDIRIQGRHRYGTDGATEKPVRYTLPVSATVAGFADTAAGTAKIVSVTLLRDTFNSGDATAAIGTDFASFQSVNCIV